MLWSEGKRCFFTCKVGVQLLSWKTVLLLLTGHVDSPCRQPPIFKHVLTGSYISVPSLQMFYHLITLIFFQGKMRSAFIARESSEEISVLKSILARSCCHSSWDRAATSPWSWIDAALPLTVSQTKAISLLCRRIVLLLACEVDTQGFVIWAKLRGYIVIEGKKWSTEGPTH